MIRKAICAGTWYPVKRSEIEAYLDLDASKEDAVACISPHAGWVYSGKVAGSVYSRLNAEAYDTYIIVAPNHTGYGVKASVYSKGEWDMPLGRVKIDEELAQELIKNSKFLQEDILAHQREHSVEVQIPFIQYYNINARIVPIVLMGNELELARDVADSIAKAVKNYKKKVLLIASTDMTHYETHEYAKKQDKLAIDKILKLDAEGLLKTVNQNGITMCGVLPATSTVLASVLSGAKSAKLIKYATSGETSGDYDAVVGYAGIIIR